MMVCWGGGGQDARARVNVPVQDRYGLGVGLELICLDQNAMRWVY